MIYLISAGPFQIDKSGQHICVGIVRYHPPHNCTYLRILKSQRNLFQHVSGRSVIRIKYNDDLPFCQLHCIIQTYRFSSVRTVSVKGAYKLILSVIFIQHFPGTVCRIIINRNNFKSVPVILTFQQRIQNIGKHLFLIMHRDQYGNTFHPVCKNIIVIEALPAQKPYNCKIKMSGCVQKHQDNNKNSITFHNSYDHFHTSFPFLES